MHKLGTHEVVDGAVRQDSTEFVASAESVWQQTGGGKHLLVYPLCTLAYRHAKLQDIMNTACKRLCNALRAAVRPSKPKIYSHITTNSTSCLQVLSLQ